MEENNSKSGKYALPNHVYDFLVYLVQLVFPAAAVLYASLGTIWHWSNVEAMVGTILAVNLFLGVILKISSVSYKNSDKPYEGDMVITHKEDGTPMYDMQANRSNLEDWPSQERVTFKVVNKDAS